MDDLPTKKDRSPIHVFHVEDAVKFGVKAAVLLQNLRMWLDKNLASNRNIQNGRVWSYNTRKAFTKYHPYWTEAQIRYQLEKLEDEGVLLTDRFNKHKYDQTIWYSVNELKYSVSSELPRIEEILNST